MHKRSKSGKSQQSGIGWLNKQYFIFLERFKITLYNFR